MTISTVGYVGRKFALQTKEGKITRVGKILQEYTFLDRKHFYVKSNSVEGMKNMHYYSMSLAYLHRKNIMFLPPSFPLTYQKLVHFDKNGKKLKKGQAHLAHHSERISIEY